MADIVDIHEGAKEILDRLEKISSPPKIIAVYGVPDSGKTFLIDFLGDKLEAQGLKVRQRQPPAEHQFHSAYQVWPYFISASKEKVQGEITKDLEGKDVVMYHCPWRDLDSETWAGREDPHETLRANIGRGADLRVAIFNPHRTGRPIGEYDLIISNHSSKEKPCCS